MQQPQQNNNNYTNNRSERPLQKSMFLPQTQQYISRNNGMQYQYQDIMKRSNIDNKYNNYQYNQFNSNNIQTQPQTPIHQFNNPLNNNPNINNSNLNTNLNNLNSNLNNLNNPILNFNSNNRFKQTPRLSQFQQIPQSPINSQLAIQQLQQKINQLSSTVDQHNQILKKHNLLNLKQKTLIDTQIQQIQSKIKQNVLPTMISKQTKEIYQYIFNFKLQIKSIKQQINQVNNKIAIQIPNFIHGNTKSSSTVNSVQRIQRIQQPFAQLSANVYSLQNKLLDIQKNFQNKNDDLKMFINHQIQKIKTQINHNSKHSNKLKSSTIQSTLSPIMIEYKQIFAIKNLNSQNSGITRLGVSSPRHRQQTQIIINSTTYFIDRQGYLLDNQNRYIVDVKGMQIKLQQKHLTLLKQHNVLS